MKSFVYTYKGNRASFTLDGVAEFKTKDEFKKVFDGLVDINQAWKDIVKARPSNKVSDSEEEGGGK